MIIRLYPATGVRMNETEWVKDDSRRNDCSSNYVYFIISTVLKYVFQGKSYCWFQKDTKFFPARPRFCVCKTRTVTV